MTASRWLFMHSPHFLLSIGPSCPLAMQLSGGLPMMPQQAVSYKTSSIGGVFWLRKVLYGYFVNPPKTWLVVKDCCNASATALFQNSGIQITTEGRPLLGAPLGNVDYCTSFLQSKSSSLVQEVRTLARIARTEPQVA